MLYFRQHGCVFAEVMIFLSLSESCINSLYSIEKSLLQIYSKHFLNEAFPMGI